MKYRCAGEVGAIMGAIFYIAFGGENHTTALRAREMQSPFGGWHHHLSPSSRWHNNPCLL